MPIDIKQKRARKLHTKFIFVSGGVISSVGKGVTTSSIAALLQARGLKVSPVKCDAYLNVDAGTIRPQEHGEVFVTVDGMETDQDLGNYERFLNIDLSGSNYVTNGQIYLKIITKERNFEYEGEDVEVALHVPEEIIDRLEAAAEEQNADVVICEIGGTVGEYQNMLFIEANRIMKYRHGRDCIHIHVGYLPTPPSIGEMKSKPVQNSVRQLVASGIQPDILIGRAEAVLDTRRKETLSWTCNIPVKQIFSAPNASSIYEVPELFERQGMADMICSLLNITPPKKVNLGPWRKLGLKINKIKTSKELSIAVVGKYFETGDYKLADVYISVVEAIKHAGWHLELNPKLYWVSSLNIEKEGADKYLKGMDAVVVPGGFGSRGTEGIIQAIKYARENKKPFLGLCFGLQLAVIEFARNVCGIIKATSSEIEPKSSHAVIHMMPEQEKKLLNREYGATMRLGNWECQLNKKGKTYELYKKLNRLSTDSNPIILERHRHRYECNNAYRELLEENGLMISGTTPDGRLVEVIELIDHPYFVATQFHPEFTSRPFDPHPLFVGLLKIAKS